MSDSEEIAPLPKEVEIERVIDADEVKTFRLSAVIYRAIKADEPIELEVTNPVPVLDTSGKTIGFATVSAHKDRLEAEIFLDYHTPERLNIETQSQPMYPGLFCGHSYVFDADGKASEVMSVRALSIESEEPDWGADPLK